jgi:hypothetical protein
MTRVDTSVPQGQRRVRVAFIALAVAGFLWSTRAQAAPGQVASAGEPGLLCRGAIQQAEAGSELPRHLMAAIARVESGRPDQATGRVHPWPWTTNAEGQGNFFQTKAEAIAFTRQLQARGIQSIDVGCMQINLMYHPDAFKDLEEAFDPASNTRYAIKFLRQLREKTGNWEMASAWYHSANPEVGGPYREKVATIMATEAQGLPPRPAFAAPEVLVWPVAVSSRPGMLAGKGNIIMLPRTATGAILERPNTMFAARNISTAAMLLTGATTAPGRGLDAYRMQPVRVVKLSLIASR